jgi:hypothetical protein
MGCIWDLACVDELEFAATATLLAIGARQQSIARDCFYETRLEDEREDDSDEEAENAASDSPRQIAESSQDVVTDKFLDRTLLRNRRREIAMRRSFFPEFECDGALNFYWLMKLTTRP